MSIILKSSSEIEIMRHAGKIASLALKTAGEAVRAGVTTAQLDKIAKEVILSHGAVPSFLGYGGFPAAACISINNEVIHGIPGRRVLTEGDIVSIDVGALYKGFHGDCAATFPVGEVTKDAQKLIDVTRRSFFEGIKYAKEGQRLGDIGAAIEEFVIANGCSVVRDFVGHGIGRSLHEAPEVPNFGTYGKGARLQKGMTIAVEPMVNSKTHEIVILDDKWTVVTADGSLSAHYENTIFITDGEAEILTMENV